MKVVFLAIFFCLAVVTATPLHSNTTLYCTGECQKAAEAPLMNRVMRLKIEDHKKCVEEHKCPTIKPALSNIPCKDGKAGEYDCNNIDLLSFMPLSKMGCGGDGNDIWGWTDQPDPADPKNRREYAIVGCYDGTSFVDVTDPSNPDMIAFLRTETSSSIWRDIKVYKDHAFIVSEASNHGMQVFDLKKLRDLPPNSEVKATTIYKEMGNTHNIVANEDTGFMYAVGTSTCNGGLHMINVEDPENPKFENCFSDDGYTHDAQCVIYNGPDERYQGREICFCYNEDTLTIVDVDDKKVPLMLSRKMYTGSQYTHQGWLNEDQTHLLMNDELDEMYGPNPHTRSMVWDVTNLEDPKLTSSFYSEKKAVDHNLYIKGKLAYESNYSAGLRILNIEDMENGVLKEVGYFDVDPENNEPTFRGAWSAYVYFESGNIIVSSIERGLFVLKYTGPK